MSDFKKLWARFGVSLSEPSTWRGFVTILSAVGIGLNPDQMNAIVVAGLAVTGLLNVFFKDESNPDPELGEKNVSDTVAGTRQ